MFVLLFCFCDMAILALVTLGRVSESLSALSTILATSVDDAKEDVEAILLARRLGALSSVKGESGAWSGDSWRLALEVVVADVVLQLWEFNG